MSSEENARSSFLRDLKVSHKMGLVPLMYTLILIGVLGYTVENAQDLLQDSTVQEVVGRQRTLNEQYLQQVFLERMGYQANRDRTGKVFLASIEALSEGGEVVRSVLTGETVKVPAAVDPRVQSLLSEQRDLFQDLVKQSGEFLVRPKGDDTEDVAALRALSDEITANADTLTKRVGENSTEKINDMMERVSLVVILAGLCGMVAAAYVGRQISEPLGRVVRTLLKVAQGDLREETWESAPPGKDELGSLTGAIVTMKSNLRALMRDLAQAGSDLNAAAAQVAASSQQQSAAVAEQMAAVQQTTATMEELGQSGMQVSTRARDVGAAAENRSNASAGGLEAVQSTYRIMEQIRDQVQITAENIVALSEKNNAVREVISTVNDIAERANLLALNASIEAASAGAQGARFSVVAEELKHLADQAKGATGEVRGILGDIEERIHRSVMFTEEAVKRVERGRQEAENAENTISELNTATVESVRAFQQIAASASQQQIGVEQVVQALQSIREASEQTTLGIVQLDQASSSLGALVEQLLRQTVQFKT